MSSPLLPCRFSSAHCPEPLGVSFLIMVRFCHHVLQRNQSLIARFGSPLVESQRPLSVFLPPNWFLEREGEERRTFAALDSSWFSFLPAVCPWADDPVGSVFPSSGPAAVGPLNKGERLAFFTLLGPSLVPSLFSQASLWCSWKKKLKADTGQVFSPTSSSKWLALGRASFHFLPGKGNLKT